VSCSSVPIGEVALLTAAGEGDREAFSALVESAHAGLLAHCYRMLGSTQDAEEALQETLLRAWRAAGKFEGRSSVRTWLYSIATNSCLTVIERRRRRPAPVDHRAETNAEGAAMDSPADRRIEPFSDNICQAAAPEARYDELESVELAFIAAIQHLTPRQRAVLICCDVLAFSAREAAETLGTTTASVTSALQRARRATEARLPERSQQETLRSLGDRRLTELVEAYIDAWHRQDVGAVIALLTHDANFAMPPLATSLQRARRDRVVPDGRTVVRTMAVACAASPGERSRGPGLLRLAPRRGPLSALRAECAHAASIAGQRRDGLSHPLLGDRRCRDARSTAGGSRRLDAAAHGLRSDRPARFRRLRMANRVARAIAIGNAHSRVMKARWVPRRSTARGRHRGDGPFLRQGATGPDFAA
jgi:RNA polymerase sigma-70 factor, ECF subfamily